MQIMHVFGLKKIRRETELDMKTTYYIYDEVGSEEEAKARDEWNEYARLVEENNRKERRMNRAVAFFAILVIAAILVWVFFGKAIMVLM